MNTQQRPADAAGTITIGRDLTVHRMGFGAMRLCGPGVLGEPSDRSGALDVLRRALDLGVNFIDTADAYGPHVNEEMIAEALAPYRDDVVIATKGGSVRGPQGQWGANGDPAHLRETCEGSLRRLRVDRIDLYQLHTVDPKVPFEETVGVLAALREEGKIRHIGLSNVDVQQLHRAQKIVPIVSVQNAYNLGDRRSEPVLEACERDGLAFLPYFPIGAGDLSRDSALAEAALRHDATAAQVALAWLLARSKSMLPIPGTSSITHLEENVAAASLKLTADELQVLER